MTDLGPVGTVTAHANDINDAGQAVGSFSATGTTGPRAFVWQDGLLTVLSDLHSGAGGSAQTASSLARRSFRRRPFSKGQSSRTAASPRSASRAPRCAINDYRQVVGTINHAMPFFWTTAC